MEKIEGFDIIEKFLDDWRDKSYAWYMEQKAKYDKARFEKTPNELLYEDKWNKRNEMIEVLDKHFERGNDETDLNEIKWRIPWGRGFQNHGLDNSFVIILDEEYHAFQDKWSHVIKHLNKKVSYEESVKSMLDKEYERKYIKLVSDVTKLTENVEKADLHIGATGNIEGTVEGRKGKAELWSTLSGGEIQCFHFRFYCRKRA